MPSCRAAALLTTLVVGTTASGAAEPLPRPESAVPAFRRETFRLPAGFDIDLVAAEPLVVHPVAIDWAGDGRLWVAEAWCSSTNPTGGEPLGRVSLLQDLNADGRYERGTVFLDSIPWPTSVLGWGKGVLICAAPDILYAEDTNGDGKADVAERLFVGFSSENRELRLNSLSLGLDDWVYGANGSGGGTIRSLARMGADAGAVRSSDIRITGYDFRFRGDTGEFGLAAGMSAGGRARDDWGNWFGCAEDGSLWQYPLAYTYCRRNPFVTEAGEVRVDAGRTVTGANATAFGPAIYRDDLAGSGFRGDAFVCHPNRARVSRLELEPAGIAFTARETETEAESGFLSASDPSFQPVQVRTGPDGALWIVDRRNLAGGSPPLEGRIYRLHPRGRPLRTIHDLEAMEPALLAAALDTANGTERDRIQRRFLELGWAARRSPGVIDRLARTVREAGDAAGRVQALCVLRQMGALTAEALEGGLTDGNFAVRAQAIRSCEPFLAGSTDAAGVPVRLTPRLLTNLLQRVDDAELRVRFQLACSLGEWPDRRAGRALGQLAVGDLEDRWMRAAVLSSAVRFPDEILEVVLPGEPASAAAPGFIAQLLATAVESENATALERVVAMVSAPRQNGVPALQMVALAALLDSLERRVESSPKADTALDSLLGRVITGGTELFQQARSVAGDASRPLSLRRVAVGLLGHEPPQRKGDFELLLTLLNGSESGELRLPALRALLATRQAAVATALLQSWSHLLPAVRREIIGNLVIREEWAKPLLEAVGRGVVATSEITPANRERLLNDPAAPVRERAAAVFAADLPPRRTEFLAKFEGALALTGVPPNGRRVFENNCSPCHQVAGLGHAVGPDLTALRHRTVPELFASILDPSATIEPAYVSYEIETGDGRSLSGVLKSETDTALTIVQGGGTEETVPLKQVAEIRASNLSLMPEGLERNLSVQDLADLLAFLQSNQK